MGRPQRTYIPGRGINKHGPRETEPVPDPARVERLLAGDRSLVVSKADRDAALDAVDRGLSAAEVAVRLGVSQRTVQRRRAARRAA